jgi:hypothetical protein
MTWKGFNPVIKLMETTCQKGVKMSKKAFKAISHRIDRDASLPEYYMTIQPQINGVYFLRVTIYLEL